MATTTAPKSFLVRLRPKDTEFAVSEDTFSRLMDETGLNQTELVHRALRHLADSRLPHYELDDGPLTEVEYAMIDKHNPLAHLSVDDYSSPLFGDD